MRILWYGLLTDVMQTYIALNPIFSLPEQEARSLRSQGLLLNVLNVLAYMGKSYGMLNMGYDGMALVSVAFGFSEPKYWPVVFGRWRDAYTVRRFWGLVHSYPCQSIMLTLTQGVYGSNGYDGYATTFDLAPIRIEIS